MALHSYHLEQVEMVETQSPAGSIALHEFVDFLFGRVCDPAHLREEEPVLERKIGRLKIRLELHLHIFHAR